MNRWIFFDVGYTLIDECDMWKRRVAETGQMAEEAGQNVSEQEIFDKISQLSAEYKPIAPNVAKWLGLKDMAPYRGECERIYPDAAATLKHLKRFYKLGVIANQPEKLNERLAKFDVLKYFDLVVSSDDVGIVKPNPKIFMYALSQADCLPQEAVMVGDRLDNDIAPAKKLGFTTVRIMQGICAVQQPMDVFSTPDYTVDNLAQLVEIFG